MDYISSSPEASIAEKHFKYIDQTLGLSCAVSVATLSLTNNENAQPVAFFLFCIFMYLSVKDGKQYGKVKDSYLKAYQGFFGKIRLGLKVPLFSTSLTCLWFIVMGKFNIGAILAFIGL